MDAIPHRLGGGKVFLGDERNSGATQPRRLRLPGVRQEAVRDTMQR